MHIGQSIEQLARACFARLCPWIAAEHPDWPIEKSTTMRAFIEGASLVKFGTRTYSYKHTSRMSYYMTINGRQVGGVCFSQREVDEQIERVQRGESW